MTPAHNKWHAVVTNGIAENACREVRCGMRLVVLILFLNSWLPVALMLALLAWKGKL